MILRRHPQQSIGDGSAEDPWLVGMNKPGRLYESRQSATTMEQWLQRDAASMLELTTASQLQSRRLEIERSYQAFKPSDGVDLLP